MSPTEEANRSQSDLRIPWFGVRRMAHKLASQVKELRAERDTKSGQLERLATMGRELVTEVKKATVAASNDAQANGRAWNSYGRRT
jgi:hypothetical protein